MFSLTVYLQNKKLSLILWVILTRKNMKILRKEYKKLKRIHLHKPREIERNTWTVNVLAAYDVC